MSIIQEEILKIDEIKIVFLIVFILMGVGFLYAYLNKDALYSEIISGITIGGGTALLAFYTARLTEATIDEGRKERRQIRIKEQLEGLYAPLMSQIDNFKQKYSRSSYSNYVTFMSDIRNRYEYLATPEFLTMMREYYSKYDVGFRNTDDWEEFITPKINLLKKDYELLIKEYLSLIHS